MSIPPAATSSACSLLAPKKRLGVMRCSGDLSQAWGDAKVAPGTSTSTLGVLAMWHSPAPPKRPPVPCRSRELSRTPGDAGACAMAATPTPSAAVLSTSRSAAPVEVAAAPSMAGIPVAPPKERRGVPQCIWCCPKGSGDTGVPAATSAWSAAASMNSSPFGGMSHVAKDAAAWPVASSLASVYSACSSPAPKGRVGIARCSGDAARPASVFSASSSPAAKKGPGLPCSSTHSSPASGDSGANPSASTPLAAMLSKGTPPPPTKRTGVPCAGRVPRALGGDVGAEPATSTRSAAGLLAGGPPAPKKRLGERRAGDVAANSTGLSLAPQKPRGVPRCTWDCPRASGDAGAAPATSTWSAAVLSASKSLALEARTGVPPSSGNRSCAADGTEASPSTSSLAGVFSTGSALVPQEGPGVPRRWGECALANGDVGAEPAPLLASSSVLGVRRGASPVLAGPGVVLAGTGVVLARTGVVLAGNGASCRSGDLPKAHEASTLSSSLNGVSARSRADEKAARPSWGTGSSAAFSWSPAAPSAPCPLASDRGVRSKSLRGVGVQSGMAAELSSTPSSNASDSCRPGAASNVSGTSASPECCAGNAKPELVGSAAVGRSDCSSSSLACSSSSGSPARGLRRQHRLPTARTNSTSMAAPIASTPARPGALCPCSLKSHPKSARRPSELWTRRPSERSGLALQDAASEDPSASMQSWLSMKDVPCHEWKARSETSWCSDTSAISSFVGESGFVPRHHDWPPSSTNSVVTDAAMGPVGAMGKQPTAVTRCALLPHEADRTRS
mmetsp:Transcript_8286/g.20919  ORF Transcript_8286/g.20919 Transcript_8286/m.20919 type:complete len:790 (+) Transcript_8286:1235-3604(+)